LWSDKPIISKDYGQVNVEDSNLKSLLFQEQFKAAKSIYPN
jgi:hypothetical protein